MERQLAETDSDAAGLVRRAQHDDHAAFDTLYGQHVGRVYAVCLRMSASRQEAERLTQDVFVRAWQRIKTFRGDSAFGSWLYRLTVNVVLQGAWAQLLMSLTGQQDIAFEFFWEFLYFELPTGVDMGSFQHRLEFLIGGESLCQQKLLRSGFVRFSHRNKIGSPMIFKARNTSRNPNIFFR